jgi:diguanylate cyclase (GGDEF)-like protein
LDTALSKARFAGLIFACASSAPNVSATYPGAGRTWQLVGSLAMASLLALYVITFVRRRTFSTEPAVVAALIVVGGSSLTDPDAVIALTMGALTLLSMHSTIRQAVVRLVLLVAALLTSIAVSPAAHDLGLSWYAEQNITLIPMLTVMALLNAAVPLLLLRQQEAAGREALLARAGLELINLTDPDDVRAVAGRTFMSLCAEWPRHKVLVVRVRDGSAIVEAATRDDLMNRAVPAVSVLGTDATTLVPLDEAARRALDAVAGEQRRWWGMAFGGEDDDRFLLVGGPEVPAALSDALRSMATYWSLAESNCRTHAELRHRADSDQLTALYNRRWFLERLAAARDESADQAGINALMMIDLDDFKQVNDVYGHAAGDGLLMEIADRITRTAGTTGWAARLGGDEFALLLTGLPGPEAADRAAEALRESLLAPVRVPEGTVSAGASIGIAIATPDLTAGDLMRCADIAMYSAKAKGKNRVERFTPEQHGSVAHIRRIEEHLTQAIDKDEILVHYQPRVDLRSGRCVGLEALARWHDASLGPVPPAAFVPLAVRTGYIKPLGDHVLRVACERLAAWRTDPAWHELTLSVNVAAVQLYDPSYPESVRRVLDDTGVPAESLILEITGEPVIDLDRAGPSLTAITALGVRIALDNFGAEGTSFAALRAFPVHQLKIDPKLVSGDGTTDRAMVELIVAASVVFEAHTVAVGVETEEQAHLLRDAGVGSAQGYLFAAPMPADDLPAEMARTHHHGHRSTTVGAAQR